MVKVKKQQNSTIDSRLKTDTRFEQAGPSRSQSLSDSNASWSEGEEGTDNGEANLNDEVEDQTDSGGEEDLDELDNGMDPDGFAGPSGAGGKIKTLTPEALAAAHAAQERAGVVYISRIPPGMRPTKVRHLMSHYGEVGRVYLQQEGASPIQVWRTVVCSLLTQLFSVLQKTQSEHIYGKNTLRRKKRTSPRVG